jgi:hypothetical protein
MKKKNQKPIEINPYFKYRCSDSSCGYDHWISLQEAKTKNFKIVCDCGNIIRPKQIKTIKIAYKENTIVKTKPNLDTRLLTEYTDVLCGYGFTHDESVKLINIAYQQIPNGSKREIIKLALTSTGELE